MIHGIGIDIVATQRIERIYALYPKRFMKRILHLEEYRYLPSIGLTTFLASRFAVKEAFVKALGIGFRHGISFRDIAVLKQESGAPILSLDGIAKQYHDTLAIRSMHISLSHEQAHVVAMVLLER